MKISFQNNSYTKIALTQPNITFKGFKANKTRDNFVSNKVYGNIFTEKLKATPNANLKGILEMDPTVYDPDKSLSRLTNFSKYLKESMVGFYLPKCELDDNKENNCNKYPKKRNLDSKQWFEEACTFFIKAAANEDVDRLQYFKNAKNFWTLLSKVDPYWTSNEFINYLQTINTNAGVNETIKAIKKIKEENKNIFNITFAGYGMYLKKIPELIQNGCAYSGQEFTKKHSLPNSTTTEHIFPHNKGEKDNCNIANRLTNYALVTNEFNELRWNLPLLDFLKGKDVNCFEAKMTTDRCNKVKNALEIFAQGKGLKTISASLDPDSSLFFHDIVNIMDKLQNNEDVTQIKNNLYVLYSEAKSGEKDTQFLIEPPSKLNGNSKYSIDIYQQAVNIFNDMIMTPTKEQQLEQSIQRVINKEDYDTIKSTLPLAVATSLDDFMKPYNSYLKYKKENNILLTLKPWYLRDCFKKYIFKSQ